MHQKTIQLVLDLEVRGETPSDQTKGSEPGSAATVSPASARSASRKSEKACTPISGLMEAITDLGNMRRALKRVRANKGSPGVDGMTVDDLSLYLKHAWPQILASLLEGRYFPQPIRRVEIPKPDGGMRQLGIPTVLDRLIQQSILQVLTPIFDPTFSGNSYGFRPGKSAHQALEAARQYAASYGVTFGNNGNNRKSARGNCAVWGPAAGWPMGPLITATVRGPSLDVRQ